MLQKILSAKNCSLKSSHLLSKVLVSLQQARVGHDQEASAGGCFAQLVGSFAHIAARVVCCQLFDDESMCQLSVRNKHSTLQRLNQTDRQTILHPLNIWSWVARYL